MLASSYPFADVMWTMLVFFRLRVVSLASVHGLVRRISPRRHLGHRQSRMADLHLGPAVLRVFVYLIAHGEGYGQAKRRARSLAVGVAPPELCPASSSRSEGRFDW